MSLVIGHLEHFRRRVLVDALQEATSAYWLRRAASFAAVGTPTADETALACERHARIVADTGLDAEALELIRRALTEEGS